jgi:hypothetical protein
MSENETVTNCTTSFCTGTPTIAMALIPRKADRIFSKDVFSNASEDTDVSSESIRDRLPHWIKPQAPFFSIDANKRIKTIEYRMYVDLATKTGNKWWARKKISVVCWYRRPKDKYRPVVKVSLSIKRISGSADIRFILADGTFTEELKEKNRPATNGQGIAEFTIAHPPLAVSSANQTVQIEATAEIPLIGSDGKTDPKKTATVRKTIDIQLFRNSAIGDIELIFKDKADPDSAQNIWCFQPAEPEPSNEGIKKLQEVLNEVVSRHSGIPDGPPADTAHFTFIPLTGVFDEPTKRALNQYLTYFPQITSGKDYPYNLNAIGIDKDFLSYIKEDYAPYDPDAKANRGTIVDRQLLIGNILDTQPAQIDGLWELYKGVVEEFKTQVRAFAQSYLDCDEFWLHRHEQDPYSPATDAAKDSVYRCTTKNVKVKTLDHANAPTLSLNGADVEINDGEHFLVLEQKGSWVKIKHPSGEGWVIKDTDLILNDRGKFRAAGTQIQNHGNHGINGPGYFQHHTLNGVAYTYGGKQTPEKWRESLQKNPHAKPDQIVNYTEYGADYKFGETKDEYDEKKTRNTWRKAGCDCAGMYQNCVIHSFFPNTTTRIVPNSMIPDTSVPDNWLKSGAFIRDDKARLVARPLDLDHHWVGGGDLISHKGHIVMVAEDKPTMTGAHPNDFKIMHEWGGDTKDKTQFRRKSIRSPFSWYGKIKERQIGKIYIWQ